MELNVVVKDSAVALGNDHFLAIFLLAVFIDYFTGVAKAAIWRVADSSLSLKGLVKHCSVISFVVLVSLASKVYSFPELEFIVLGLFSVNYALSITENLSVMFGKEPKYFQAKIRKDLKKLQQLKEND